MRSMLQCRDCFVMTGVYDDFTWSLNLHPLLLGAEAVLDIRGRCVLWPCATRITFLSSSSVGVMPLCAIPLLASSLTYCALHLGHPKRVPKRC